MNSKSLRKFAVLSIFALPLALAGCKKGEAAPAATDELRPIKVATSAAELVDVDKTLRLTGTLTGARQTELAANVNGKVLSTHVERGTKVKAGDLIARIDVRGAALQLAEAKVQVESSKTQQAIDQVECARYDQLKARGAVTDVEYEQVMARCKRAPINLDAAQAKVNLAAKSVGDGIIVAPFSGVVSERFVEVGEYVQPQTRVIAMADVDALHLELSLPEAHFPLVKVGSKLTFSVLAYGERSFPGTVAHISGAVRSTRDILVEATAPNEDGALLPGMFAEVQLVVGTEKLPSVPKTAVFERNGKSNVLVQARGLLEERVVQVRQHMGAVVAIGHGIAEGDLVVTEYRPELKNGQPVL
jgi:membrane fusion protein, multidrug efflux system